MFGMGFIFRILLALIGIVLFVMFTVGVAWGLSKLFQFAWDILGDAFYDQAEWFKDKFHWLKPWRLFTVPGITIGLMLCCIVSVIFMIVSGNGLEGTELR